MKIWSQFSRRPEGYCHDIWLFKDRGDGRELVAQPVDLLWVEYEFGGKLPAPSFILPERDRLELVESLKQSQRFRGESPLLGDYEIRVALESTKYHLEDMRRLVFKSRGLEPPR